MKRFILRRMMKYTETKEIEAESWDAAKEILLSDVEFDACDDGVLIDQNIEFIGEVDDS